MVSFQKGFLLDNGGKAGGKRRKERKEEEESLTTTQRKRITTTTTTTNSIDDDKKTYNNKEVLSSSSSSSSNNNNNSNNKKNNPDKISNDDDDPKTKMTTKTIASSSSSSSRTTRTSREEGRRVVVDVGNNGGGSDSSGGLFVKGFLNNNNNNNNNNSNNKRSNRNTPSNANNNRNKNNKESSSSSSSKRSVPPNNRRKEEFSYTSEESSTSLSIKNNNNNKKKKKNKINGFAKGFLNNNDKVDIKKKKKNNNNNKNNNDDDDGDDNNNNEQQQQITTTKNMALMKDDKNKNDNDIGSRGGGGFSKGFLLTTTTTTTKSKKKKQNRQQKRNNNQYSYNDNTTNTEEEDVIKESQPSSSDIPSHQHNKISSDLLQWEQQEIIIPTASSGVNKNINNTTSTNSSRWSRRDHKQQQPPPPPPTSSSTRLVQILSSRNNNNDDDDNHDNNNNNNNNNKQFPLSASSDNNDNVDNYNKGSSSIDVDSGSTIKHPLISIIDDDDDDDDNLLNNSSSTGGNDNNNNNNNSDNHDEEDKIIINMKKKNEPILDIGITTTQMKSKNGTIKQQQEDEPLWKEVSTTIRRINTTKEDRDIFVTSQQQQQQQIEQRNLQSPFTSSSPTDPAEDTMKEDGAAAEYVAENPSEVTKSTKQSSCYIDFQQDLESFMWNNNNNNNNNNNASKSNRPRRRTSTTLPTDDDTTTTTRDYANTNNKSSIIFLETVKDWDPTKVRWSWEWILSNNSTKNSGKQRQQTNLSSSKQRNSTPRQQLIMTLLRHHPTSIVPYLIIQSNNDNNNNNNNTQEEGKIMALQCVRTIQDYCIHNLERKKNSTTMKKMICKKKDLTDWKNIVLNALIQILFQQQQQQQQPLPRRTVLAQNVCTAAICVIANIAFEFITIISEEEGRQTGHYHSIINELESILFPDISNHFEHILNLQISWKKKKQQQQQHQAANNDISSKKAAAESSSRNMKKKKKNNRLMIIILEDWLRINQSYKSGKISSFLWCNQLFGIEFKTFPTWGGLLDILVTNKSPSSSNVSSYTNKYIQDVEDAISECDKVFETTRRRKRSSNNNDGEDDDTNEFIIGRSLFRGVLVSVVTDKDASSSSFQEMLGPSLGLLSKCKRNQDFSALVLAFLDFIWWDSDGLPPDIKSVPHKNTDTISIPESIDIILDSLTKCRKTDEQDGALENDHDPTFQAISRILSRCIDAYYDSFALTKAIVARLGIGICTIQILLDLIQRFDDMGHGPNDESNKTAVEDTRDNGLIPYAAKILIDNIPKSSYLRSYLRKESSYGLYSSPIPVTVPKLLRLLSSRQGNESETNEIRSTILMALKSILRAHVQIGNTDCVVKETINALDTLQEEVKNNGVDLVGDLCGKLGGGWRRELLVNSSISTDAFGDVLLSIGDAMCASPSSLTPLTLLGSIVGVDLDRTNVRREDSVRMRIMVAITRLIMFCTDRLHQSNTIKGKDAVFSRLSPLLMLRRIPVTYFEIAREGNKVKGSEELEVALSVLTTELATRLDINQTTRTITEISAEERRLAAEVAGRCLSFGATENDREQTTIFGGLCKPAFSALSHQCVSRIGNLCISTIRSARAALYAACIHVPFAKGRNYFFFAEDAYLLTSCFALDIVNLDTDKLEDEVAGEFLQLQRGCIQFFAYCVEKSVVSQNNSSENSSRPLVIECKESIGQTEATEDPSLTALRRICRNLTAIIRGGKVDEPFIKGKWSKFVGITEASPVSYSVSARVCIWNCFIIAAQSMNIDDGSLIAFAKSILPWVIEWGNPCTVPNETSHPLCVAAALQLTFTLVTRTRTLECLTANNSQGPPIKTVVRDAHDWALEAAKDNSTISDSNSGSAMRLAGLKLLLAIITISSDETSLPTHLTPNQVGKSFSVVHGIANLDPNPDVRNLASRILGFRP